MTGRFMPAGLVGSAWTNVTAYVVPHTCLIAATTVATCSCARFTGVLFGRRMTIFLPSTDSMTAGLKIALAIPRIASVICGHACAGSTPVLAGASATVGVLWAGGAGISEVFADSPAGTGSTGVACTGVGASGAGRSVPPVA